MKKESRKLNFLVCLVILLALIVSYKKPGEVKAAYMPNTYEGMTYVKIIRENGYKDLEDKVNNFIKDKIVLDIDYGVGANSYDTCYSCCIHYIK